VTEKAMSSSLRPRIAIPTPNSDAEYSARVLPQYMKAVEDAGGEPVEVPISASPREIAQIAKTCDGVLLPGSPADVDPQKYGATRDPQTAIADVKREDADELLIQDAQNMRKPIFGICYGMQSLNVWRTGTLVQHITSPVQHTKPAGWPRDRQLEHPVIVEGGTRLGAIMREAIHQEKGSPKISVNSSHHQSVAVPGDGLRIVARSPEDGVVEAIENVATEQFAIGVQWHPERTYEHDEPSRAIFRAFLAAAREWHAITRLRGTDFETLEP
jgi:putative glutamine amidotransferase